MKRLLKYCLALVFLLTLLGIIVPLGLYAYKYSHPTVQASEELLNQFYIDLSNLKLTNPSTKQIWIGSISSIIVFNVAASILLFIQQFFWFKFNKKEQYAVPEKLTKNYKYVGYVSILLIIISIACSSTAFSVPIENPIPKNACYTRIWIYGGPLIAVSILSLVIIGYSEYINLRILYNQNIQMVDEGVANGTYDPVTRTPYSEIQVGDNENNQQDTNNQQSPQLDQKTDCDDSEWSEIKVND